MWWVIGVAVTLVVVVVGLGVLTTALVLTGGPSTDLVCTDSVSGAERTVQSTVVLSDALQARLDALDDQLDAGSAGQVNFNESDAMSRALQYALEFGADIPIEELVICFQDGGVIEARAKVDVGPFGGTVKAQAKATVDLSGGTIRIELTDFSVGNLPGFANFLIEGTLEDEINDVLADETLDHSYSFSVEEINALLSGTP